MHHVFSLLKKIYGLINIFVVWLAYTLNLGISYHWFRTSVKITERTLMPFSFLTHRQVMEGECWSENINKMQYLGMLDINKVAVILLSFLSISYYFYTYEFPRTPVFLEEENVWLSVTDANYLHHFKLSWGKIGKVIVPRKWLNMTCGEVPFFGHAKYENTYLTYSLFFGQAMILFKDGSIHSSCFTLIFHHDRWLFLK